MPSEVIIIYSRQIDSSDLNFTKLVNFFGLAYKLLNLNDFDQNIDYLFTKIYDAHPCIALNGKTLNEVLSCFKSNDYFRNLIFSCASYLFVYDLKPGRNEDIAINYLTKGVLNSLQPLGDNDRNYVVNTNCKTICKQFSGLSFGPINKACDFRFIQKQNSDCLQTLVSIDNDPFFVKWEERDCQLFLIANNRIIDLNEKITGSIKVKEHFSQIMPSVMFLKYVFGDMCWHSENSCASFIIDDPLLRRQYGYLNFNNLLKLMNENSFHTNIGFIPYNYKKSDSEIATIIAENPNLFSISIHGCNHTKKEFGVRDCKALNGVINLAKERMFEHEKATKISHDNVMIFPQGVFSKNSMKVLKANNFLAAVNTSTTPVDETDGLELQELLNPAVMKFGNFPLFLRRYPIEYLDLIFDSFLGKPILIVEHHNYFREGYNNLLEFLKNFKSFEKDINWNSLDKIITSSYLLRERPDGTTDIKLFSNKIIIDNRSNIKKKYNIIKHENGEVQIEKILLNGIEIKENLLDDDLINLIIDVEPGLKTKLEIIYKNEFGYKFQNDSGIKKFKIFFRRFLSEIRDDYLSKSDLLLSTAILIKRGLETIGKH